MDSIPRHKFGRCSFVFKGRTIQHPNEGLPTKTLMEALFGLWEDFSDGAMDVIEAVLQSEYQEPMSDPVLPAILRVFEVCAVL